VVRIKIVFYIHHCENTTLNITDNCAACLKMLPGEIIQLTK